MANRLSELMAEPDRGSRHAMNFLTKSFRDTLADLGTDEKHLHALALTYLRNGARQLAGPDGVVDESKIANDKGNLKKEMEKDAFTIKVWMKLFYILRPKTLTVTINGEWHDGHKLNNGKGFTYHPLDLLNNLADDEIDDDAIDEEFIASWRKTIENHYEQLDVDASNLVQEVVSSYVSKHERIPETVDVN